MFDDFLEQYHGWLLESAEHFVEIMRREMTGIYATVKHDPEAVRDWKTFADLVDSPVAFRDKYERYQELKRAACGLSPEKSTH
jgi:hypothetical protein